MKHLWLGIGLLVVLLVFCILSTWQLGRVSQDMAALLQSAEAAAQAADYDKAARLVQQALDRWDGWKGLAGTLLRHDETDTVFYTLRALLEYARMEQDDEFFGTLAEAVAMVEHLGEMEQPTYYNFL